MTQTFTFTATAVDPLITAIAYPTIAYADEYFSTKLNTEAWDDASVDDQGKALVQATRAINLLDYHGRPTQAAVDAGNQFPRGAGGGTDSLSPYADDTEVPDAVIRAACEEALSLLSGSDPDVNIKNTRVTSEAYSSVRASYDNSVPLAHEMSGITSPAAWRLLMPFLRDKRNITMIRV